MTQAEVTEVVERRAGLHVTVRQHPRLVGDGCSACGSCVDACPARRTHDFDLGMSATKAIYLPHAAAVPTRYVIDTMACLGPECSRCATVCPQGAVDFSMMARELELDVRAVIWATGWDPYDPTMLRELGFGTHPDIITNLMMERLASPQGPTQGRILCPSNGRVPRRVAFVQCAGSRDKAHLPYCSGVCCLASAKQARYLVAASPLTEVAIYSIDRRAQGTAERFLAETSEHPRVRHIAGKVAAVRVERGSPTIEFEDVAAGHRGAEAVDLVVLAAGMVPTRGDSALAVPLVRDADGFLVADQPSPRHVVAGCAREPLEVASCVRDATRAVARALACTGKASVEEVRYG